MADVVVSIASVISAVTVIGCAFFSIFKLIESSKKNKDCIDSIKAEQSILTRGVLACLQGLKEQGCNGPVTKAIEDINNHLNEEAHR